MSQLINYLEQQLVVYKHLLLLSLKQKNEAAKSGDSPSLLAIVKERTPAIEKIQLIEDLIKKLDMSGKKPDKEVSEVQNNIRIIIEKIISNDNETNELVKEKKEALTSELKGLKRGKSLSKKYGNDGHVPNLLSIRK